MPTNADNTNAPRSIVSIADLSKEEILSLIRLVNLILFLERKRIQKEL